MSIRPDRLTISLGPNADDLKDSLFKLAADLNIYGRKGPSISQLVIWLAETYQADPKSTVELLNIAGHVAAGGDLDEWLK